MWGMINERDSWITTSEWIVLNRHAEACKCFVVARAAFFNSCNKIDKQRDGNEPSEKNENET